MGDMGGTGAILALPAARCVLSFCNFLQLSMAWAMGCTDYARCEARVRAHFVLLSSFGVFGPHGLTLESKRCDTVIYSVVFTSRAQES
ncbi:hypothetical protein NL676_027395 [Syzygium grande]|nr:hypothetical protein NL676_027395 [Syzygium grande]